MELYVVVDLTRPCPQGELVPRGPLLLCIYQVAKIAEIFYLNQQSAFEKQLDPGR